MKKIKKLLLLALSLAFSATMLVACGEKGDDSSACQHTGGTATCTEKAKCDVCGEEYGELLAHDYATAKKDADKHWNECACGAKDAEAAHVMEDKYDETNHWTECVCGEKTEDVAHTMEGKYDATNHWTECECGYKTENVAHTLEGKYDATNHWTA